MIMSTNGLEYSTMVTQPSHFPSYLNKYNGLRMPVTTPIVQPRVDQELQARIDRYMRMNMLRGLESSEDKIKRLEDENKALKEKIVDTQPRELVPQRTGRNIDV